MGTDKLRKYLRSRHSLDDKQMVEEFEKVVTATMQPVDVETADFRKECENIGFSVAIPAGCSEAKALQILRSERTREVLKELQEHRLV